MVKVTLPEQQQDKKPSYPYFAKTNVGSIIFVASQTLCVVISAGPNSLCADGESFHLVLPEHTPIHGPITFENVFE